jgi:hypothetical protein
MTRKNIENRRRALLRLAGSGILQVKAAKPGGSFGEDRIVYQAARKCSTAPTS